jgi:hypothetical protein
MKADVFVEIKAASSMNTEPSNPTRASGNPRVWFVSRNASLFRPRPAYVMPREM